MAGVDVSDPGNPNASFDFCQFLTQGRHQHHYFRLSKVACGAFDPATERRDFRSPLIVFGRVDNLFDRHYGNPTGLLQPGIGSSRRIKAKLPSMRRLALAATVALSLSGMAAVAVSKAAPDYDKPNAIG